MVWRAYIRLIRKSIYYVDTRKEHCEQLTNPIDPESTKRYILKCIHSIVAVGTHFKAITTFPYHREQAEISS